MTTRQHEFEYASPAIACNARYCAVYKPKHFIFAILCLTVWGVEPDVTHQTSWLHPEHFMTSLCLAEAWTEAVYVTDFASVGPQKHL